MRMRVLGCSGGSAPARHLSGYLLDDRFAIDAGSLTTALEIEAQCRVDAVALTHAHLDHTWSFPLFLANRFGTSAGTCTLFADAATIAAVKGDLFNGRVWPDFSEIPAEGRRSVEFRTLEPGTATRVLGRYDVEAIPVHHAVPSQAYLVRADGRSAIVCGDTTVTDVLWDTANRQPDLRGIVLECSFPNKMAELSKVSGHLTPEMFGRELGKLRKDVPVYATHIKPQYRNQVIDELRALREPRMRILEDGQVVDF
jgi:cAMP phosphodiesterase